MPITQPAATDVGRRLQAAGMQLETAVAFIGCLIVLLSDIQGLSLIPRVRRTRGGNGLGRAEQASVRDENQKQSA